MAPEYIYVNGCQLKVWAPDKNGEGFQISDGGGWISGLYDSREAALKAFDIACKQGGWELLSKLEKKINHIDGDDRLITVDDLINKNNGNILD